MSRVERLALPRGPMPGLRSEVGSPDAANFVAAAPGSSLAERTAAVAFVALVYTSLIGFRPFVTGPGVLTGTGEGDSLRQAAFILILVVALAAWVAKRGAGLVTRIPVGVTLLFALCLVSATWSIAPDITLRRASLLTVSGISLFACVDVLGEALTLRLLRFCFMVIILADWLSIALTPYSVHLINEADPNLAGSFRGLHLHKNEAGPFMGVAALLFIFTLRAGTASRLLWIAASILFLLLTRSKGGIASFVLGLSFALLHQRSQRWAAYRHIWLAALVIAPLTAIVLLSLSFEDVSALLADRTLMTGRGEIWQTVASVFAHRPFLGYGFGAVWDIPLSPIVLATHSWVARVYSAHNGYLEVATALGFVGLAGTLLVLFVSPLLAMARVPTQYSRQVSLLFGLFMMAAFNNIVESDLLVTGTVLWFAQLLTIALLRAGTANRVRR